MDDSATWPRQELSDLLGTPVRHLRPLGGGGFGRPFLADLDAGRTVFVKAQRDAAAGLFRS